MRQSYVVKMWVSQFLFEAKKACKLVWKNNWSAPEVNNGECYGSIMHWITFIREHNSTEEGIQISDSQRV